MLKSKKIIRDLKHLKGNNYFGICEAQNQKETKNLDISPFDIIRELADYEMDFRRAYGVDYDSVVYEDKRGDYCLLEEIESDNSYNWNSQVVFNFNMIRINGQEHTAVKFHRYGDVRGNYTDYMVLNMGLDDFYNTILEASRVGVSVNYKGSSYYISTDALKEACCFDIDCEAPEFNDYDVCLDIDNYRSIKSIRKALVEYLNNKECEA